MLSRGRRAKAEIASVLHVEFRESSCAILACPPRNIRYQVIVITGVYPVGVKRDVVFGNGDGAVGRTALIMVAPRPRERRDQERDDEEAERGGDDVHAISMRRVAGNDGGGGAAAVLDGVHGSTPLFG